MTHLNDCSHTDSDGLTVLIFKHKTAAQYGPAAIYFSNKNKHLLNAYLLERKHLLNLLNKEKNYVFITRHGKQMSATNINVILTSAFQAIGVTFTVTRAPESESRSRRNC